MIGYYVVLTMVVVASVTVLIYIFRPHDVAALNPPEEKPPDE